MNQHIERIIKWNVIAGNLHGATEKAPVYIDLIKEEFKEWLDALDNDNSVEELDALVDMIWVIVGRAHTKGYDLFGAMREVDRSNYSKFIQDPDKVLEEAENFLKEDIIVIPRSIEGVTVLVDLKGKIRKPSSYSPADVSPYV